MFYGQKMRELRKKKGLTTIELGKKIGVSNSYISMLETGKRDCPDGKVLGMLAEELDCAPDILTDSKIMSSFARSFKEGSSAPPSPPVSRVIYPETPESSEREAAFLREEVMHKDAEILNLKLSLNEARASLYEGTAARTGADIIRGARRLSVGEAAAGLDHAEAIIRLAMSQDEPRYGQCAREWLEKYGEE